MALLPPRRGIGVTALWLVIGLAASPAALGADRDPTGFRLSDAAAPLDYDLRLAIDPAAPRFSGEVRIRLRFARETPVLWLHAVGLDIDAAEVVEGDRRIAARVVPGREEQVGLEAEGAPFAAGEATAIVRYRGPLAAVDTRGLFRQREGGDWYAISQFEALSARRAFPCFDEPRWKTPWRLTIDAPVANVVTSNTPEETGTTLAAPAGWRRHVFAPTPPLPTYLVALAVGPFDTVDGGRAGASGTPLHFLAPRGRAADLRVARESTPALVGILEEYFGIPFPFAKLDSVPIPTTVGFGAMENAGMITYASTLLLARSFEDTTSFRRRYASVAAHELAHQWFGDLVTLAWWDDTWLNESFASWMSRKALDRYRPEWERGWLRGDRRRRALEADRLAAARSVHNPVLAQTDVYGAFDRITYDKGAEVLDMFEAWLGPERFRAGVRDYLARHAGGNATAADFFDAIGRASEHPREAVSALMAFIDQPGAPQLDVALRCDGDAPAVEVTQRRFRPLGSTAPDMRWTTPACFRYGAEGASHRQCFEVANGTHRFALSEAKACPDWLVGNAEGAGHYIARYDTALREAIAGHIAAIPEAEAVAFAGDAALLARSGLLPVEEAIALADALARHPSAAVQQGAVVLLDRLADDRLTRGELEAKVDVVNRVVMPLARRVGWVERPSDPQELRELRATLMPFAARYEDRETLRLHARELALRWIVKRDSVAATMAEPVLTTAGRFADAPMYGRLEAALMEARDRHDRRILLVALSRVRDERLRARALGLALDDRIPGSEAFFLVDDALDDDANRAAALDFLRAHFDALVAKLPQDSPGRLAGPLRNLCTPSARDAFVDLYRDRAARFQGGARRYAESLESIDLCLAATSRAASR